MTVPDHASWRTALSTGIGYVVILLAMFALLFLVPYVVFMTL